MVLLRLFEPSACQPAATREGGGALVNVDKLHKFRVDGRVGEGGRAKQGSINVLALLLELKEASNFSLRDQLCVHNKAERESMTTAMHVRESRGARDRRTLRTSSAFSGSSAGERPQLASGIGAGCVTVRNTTSGSIPAKGSGDEDADLDRELEGERARESVPVIGVGDGEAVRLRFLSGVRPRSASTLRLHPRSSRASRCRRWSSSLLRLLWLRSARRGDLGRSGVRLRYKCRGLPRVSLPVVNR